MNCVARVRRLIDSADCASGKLTRAWAVNFQTSRMGDIGFEPTTPRV